MTNQAKTPDETFVGDDGRPAYAPNGYKLVTESHPKPAPLRVALVLEALVGIAYALWSFSPSGAAALGDGGRWSGVFITWAAWGLFMFANTPDRVQRAVPAQIVATPPTRPLAPTRTHEEDW